MNELNTLVVAGAGEARSPDSALFDARARTAVRYADPAAWVTATAVGNALSEFRAELLASPHDIGMVVVSDQGPAKSMAEVYAATSAGFSSPLRYAASNPGSLAGVTCIAFGFRGPTLNLAMLPAVGVPVGLHLCAGWLGRRAARWMALATFRSDGPGTPLSRAVLLTHADLSREVCNPLTQAVTDWLTLAGN